MPHAEVYATDDDYRWAYVTDNGSRDRHREAYTRRWSAQRAARRQFPGIEVRHIYPDGHVRIAA